MRKIVDVNDKIQQEWVRPIDAAAACGLGTSRLYELLSEARGQIRSCALKSPSANKGARLINLPSLVSYFEQMAEQQRIGGGKQK
jgi:hypothetical protein